jgi:hypothetical protein
MLSGKQGGLGACRLSSLGPGQVGSEQIEVATAGEALAEYLARNTSVVNLVVKDNHGRRVKPDDLVALVAMSRKPD